MKKHATVLVRLANAVVPKSPRRVCMHSVPDLDATLRSLAAELTARGFDVTGLTTGPTDWCLDVGRVLPKRSLRGVWALARSRYVVTTHGIMRDRCWIRQFVVNVWHGEPPVKPVGRFEGEPPRRVDLAPVCSPLARAYRATEFGIDPRRVPVVGAPRNDTLLAAAGATDDRDPYWLWMPTYRDSVSGELRRDGVATSTGLPLRQDELAELMRSLTDEDIRLVVKPHPLARQDLDVPGSSVVNDALLHRERRTGAQLLGGAAGLVVDYSSAWIDYLLTRRPIVFFCPDLDAYRSTRGFNIEPFEDLVPGPLVRDVAGLVDAVAAIQRGADMWTERRDRALRLFHKNADAMSTQRVVDLMVNSDHTRR